jgi:hypothetical protein
VTCDLLTRISWRRAWASEASDDSDGVDDVPLHLGLGGSSSFEAQWHGASAGGAHARPGTRGSSGGGAFVAGGGGGGRMPTNYGPEAVRGGAALPSILAAGAAMAGDD